MTEILQIGINVVLMLQKFSPTLDLPFLLITELGGSLFIFFVSLFIYWNIDRRFAFRLGVLTIISAVVNSLLKAAFAGPRPYLYDSSVKLIGQVVKGGGVPSGHAQTCTTFWGAIAWQLQRQSVWLVSCFVIFFVSVSRLYLGVHFLHDVIVGIILGSLAVFIFAWIENFRSQRCGKKAEIESKWLFLIAVVMVGGLAIMGQYKSMTAASGLSGLVLGVFILRAKGSFEPTGSVYKDFAMFLLGTALLLSIWFGVGWFAKYFVNLSSDKHLSMGIALFKYFISGLWVGGLWPIVALHFNLLCCSSSK